MIQNESDEENMLYKSRLLEGQCPVAYLGQALEFVKGANPIVFEGLLAGLDGKERAELEENIKQASV